ncbi:PAS domain S-box protein [Noviherbaspirillum sp. CPCC 100848]|uniref:histidine kinase n=1 Tax=Noviherbaspirillum album TaxID=3080276 RepID=A0ABU6JBZ3_9BURK|nr:PAS domain S-box protein [Noviherbaspirillum sp. CPCC 100848]MEC4721065.1 PAS domain S-box protein [Noviherbaspirillum sp. CPCC 100848]
MLSGRTLTLRRAIVLTVVLGLLIPVLLISGYSWFKQYTDDIRKQTWEVLQQNADILSNGMQEALWNINQESGNALMEAMMARNPDIVRIEVRDNALGVFVASERPERREGYTAMTDKPVMYRGNTIGSVKIEVGSTQLRQVMIKGLIGSITAVLAQAVLSIVLILILLDRRLVRPLQRLGAGAERLASRELDSPFTWQRLDEIGLLSRRMEDTRISLRKLFEELDEKNRELEEDIDKRKRVEQELHEREERYRALVEQSPIAIIEWDTQFKVIEWNAAAERIFGYPREHAIGRSASFIMYEAGPDSLAMLFRPLTEGRGDSSSISLNLRADGQLITCQWSHTHIADEAGRTGRLLSIAEDITEKRRAEQALTLSEAKFAGAFRGNPDSISISRFSDGVLIDINESFVDLSGFSREEIVGKTAFDLGLWVRPDQRKLLLEEVSGDRMVRNFEWEMRTKVGTLRKCMTNATAFNAGNERYMLAVIRDVTDQRLLEERKAEADRALMRLAQGTHDMTGESFFELLVADLASALRTDCAVIALCEPDEKTRLHTIAAHVRGHMVDDFDYQSIGTPCARSLAGELHVVPSGVRESFPIDSGPLEKSWESYAGAPLRDAAGRPIGVMAIMHSEPLSNPDLVKSLLRVFSERASAELERKRTEEKLLNSERRLSAIFEWSPVAMFVTEIRGRYAIKDVNHAFEQLFRRPRNSVVGRNSDELELYCDVADRVSLVAGLERTGISQSQREIWMNRGDGGRVLVQFSAHTFSLNDESFAIVAFVDMTYKHSIENEIRELNANLEQRVVERTEELQQANLELASAVQTLNIAQEELVRSEKLAALGSLVAGVAHELNTPIGNSLMVASTLADQTRTFTSAYEANGLKRSTLEAFIRDADRAGDILVRNLHRAANLVTGFKQVAVDQTSSQRREFSVAEAVSEIMLTLWPTLRKTSFVVKQDIPAALRMDSYPGPLGQVITNLVNNTLLHGFEGRQSGTVEISAEMAGDGWIEITVADDGVGIPQANLNRIFDPFFTTKLGAGGSGLGLNITHNIVTGILGGRIRVHSELGMGTTFVLSMPMIAPQRQSEEDPLSQHSAI